MKKAGNRIINNLRYFFLILTIAFGLIAIFGTGGGDDDDNSRNEEQVSGIQAVQVLDGLGDVYIDLLSQYDEQTALDETANWLRDSPEVVPESVAISNRAIHFIFIDGTPGIFFGYDILSERGEDENIPLQISSSNSGIEFDHDGLPNLFLASENSSECWLVVPTCKASIILDPVPCWVPTATSVKNILDQAGYTAEYKYKEEVSLQALRSMDSKGVIYFGTHGDFLCPANLQILRNDGITTCEENDVILFSGETITSKNYDEYESLREDCKIVAAVCPCPRQPDPYNKCYYWAVTPKFFEDVDLCEKNLFYVHACYSLVNNSMAEALAARGTAAYVGWNREIDAVLEHYAPLSFFNLMRAGYTVEFASLNDGDPDATFYAIEDLRDIRLLTCDLQGPVGLKESISLDPPKVSFEWEEVKRAHHYHIRMGTDKSLIKTEGSDSCAGTDVVQNPGCFERWADSSFWEEDFSEAPAAVYYWAVIPTCDFTVPDIGDCYGRGEWSSVRSFKYPK